MLINLQGSSGDNGDVGNYEFLEVASVSGGIVTVSAAPSNAYDGSGDSYTTQKVFVQRVPNYTNVTTNGYRITAGDWDGGTATTTPAAPTTSTQVLWCSASAVR